MYIYYRNPLVKAVKKTEIAIIGGGAAGFFAAIHAKTNYPAANVVILEKSKKVLSKVKVSGGGRCNVTNGNTSIKKLTTAYPRGSKLLKKLFQQFKTNDTMDWFQSRGIGLVTQEDMCVFPKSQDSQTIIDCFLKECNKLGVIIKTSSAVKEVEPLSDGIIKLHFTDSSKVYNKVIVTTGGSPKRSGLEWLEKLGHQIEEPVPSLFTFNMPSESVKELMGIVVENTQVSIEGTKLIGDGPLLITHWGMSGPAILKLSAFGARILYEKNYQFKVQVNWVNIKNVQIVQEEIKNIIEEHPQKQLSSIRPYMLPIRLWHYLIEKAELPTDRKWQDIGKKGINKFTTLLTNDTYQVSGKTTFKEEFVTCGGVSLESINPKTMESLVCKNLYFAGEVTDIDGITGGYNFQAAWTTAYIAGKLLD